MHISFARLTLHSFSALTLLVRQQEEHLGGKKLGASVVISLEQSANDLHMVRLMSMSSYHLCFNKIQNGLSFWYWLIQVVLENSL